MSTFAFLVMGIIAGWIANKIVKGGSSGLIANLICGVLGAQIGGWISIRLFNISMGTFWDLRSWVISIAGAALIIAVWGLITKKK